MYYFGGNGFFKTNEATNVATLRAAFVDKNEQLEESEIVKILIQQISYEILKEKLYTFDKIKDFDSLNTTYYANVGVTPPGQKFANVQNERFSVDDVHFNEDELIEAVKIAYPERFI